MMSTIPAFLFVLFIGPLSDRLGRKWPLVLPFLGHVTIALLQLLCVYWDHWPVQAMLVENIWGLFGGGGATVSLLSYRHPKLTSVQNT